MCLVRCVAEGGVGHARPAERASRPPSRGDQGHQRRSGVDGCWGGRRGRRRRRQCWRRRSVGCVEVMRRHCGGGRLGEDGSRGQEKGREGWHHRWAATRRREKERLGHRAPLGSRSFVLFSFLFQAEWARESTGIRGDCRNETRWEEEEEEFSESYTREVRFLTRRRTLLPAV